MNVILEENIFKFFLFLECRDAFYSKLSRKKLFLEKEASLDRFPETFKEFNQWLEIIEWMYFF